MARQNLVNSRRSWLCSNQVGGATGYLGNSGKCRVMGERTGSIPCRPGPSRNPDAAEHAMAITLAEYDQLASGTTATPKLLSQVICPHCWEYFAPEDVLWIAEHIDLLGDPLLGPERHQRFLPAATRFQAMPSTPRGCRREPGLPEVPPCHPAHAGNGIAVHLDSRIARAANRTF